MENQSINSKMAVNSEICFNMTDKAVSMLLDINKTDHKVYLKNFVKHILGKKVVSNNDKIFWPAGILMLGISEYLLSSENNSQNRKITIKVSKWITEWINSGKKVQYTDDALMGVALIRFNNYLKTFDDNNSVFLSNQIDLGIDKIADFLVKAPCDEIGSIVYHPEFGNSLIFADGTGMTAMFLSAYSSKAKRKDMADLAKVQLTNFINNATDSFTSLPYHGYKKSSGEKEGIIGWGRAVGWLIMGISEYLCNEAANSSTFDKDSVISKYFINLVRILTKYLQANGGFSWQVPAYEGHFDSSGTAMIAYGIAKITNNNCLSLLLDANTLSNCNKILLSCSEILSKSCKNGFVTSSLAECIDFAQYPQKYDCYPWSQGPALAFISVFIK